MLPVLSAIFISRDIHVCLHSKNFQCYVSDKSQLICLSFYERTTKVVLSTFDCSGGIRVKWSTEYLVLVVQVILFSVWLLLLLIIIIHTLQFYICFLIKNQYPIPDFFINLLSNRNISCKLKVCKTIIYLNYEVQINLDFKGNSGTVVKKVNIHSTQINVVFAFLIQSRNTSYTDSEWERSLSKSRASGWCSKKAYATVLIPHDYILTVKANPCILETKYHNIIYSFIYLSFLFEPSDSNYFCFYIYLVILIQYVHLWFIYSCIPKRYNIS